MKNNPFNTIQFQTPFNTIPFKKIKLEHFMPAIDFYMEENREELNILIDNPEPANFDNTIAKLDSIGEGLGLVSSVFFNLNSAETNDEMQVLAQEISPKLTAFSNEVSMNPKLFKRVKEAKENIDVNTLNEEQKMLLDKTFKGFVRSGALLDEAEKEKLKKINTELSKLSLTFGENVLKETNNYQLHLTNPEDLLGIPESIKEMAALTAKEKDLDGWVFTLDYPSYVPFMTYASNRSLRKEMYEAFSSKAFKKNDNNNEDVVLKIANLRLKRANILGYDSHASFVLEERMAKNQTNVYKLLDELTEKAFPIAQKDVKDVAALANKDGVEVLERWDFGYYSEKLKKQKFDLDDEMLNPYFKLDNCINGVFETANRLYGLSFEKLKDVEVYHEDVEVYKVVDENSDLVAVFYADFFPRTGKRAGAWMTSFKSQYADQDGNHRPHVSIVCNFSKPTETKPSLLTFNELTTLFHEFGHALHGMLANTQYKGLSGTSVYWDFVELPSQILENWCYEQECLEMFAKHYETGELIPMELVQKIKDSANFLSAYQTVRQVSFGMLDFSWHGVEEEIREKVGEHEKSVMQNTELFPSVSSSNMSCSFSHIFQGGYAAGYYSYKWAEVLDADAFGAFKENGIFNKEVAKSFKENILSKGGTEHPMDLYVKFRGREPKIDSLLKRSNLV